MSLYRRALPQLSGQAVITDGGLETDLLFNRGVSLPEFCSFPLVREEEGRAALADYFDEYFAIARRWRAPLLLESTTWRAHADWVRKLGYHEVDVADFNRQAIDLLLGFREANADVTTVISGCVGPRGDGYVPNTSMAADQAQEYHRPQIETLADSAADLISALTLNYVEEAIGVARAADEAGVPCAISFTVETDGRLPTGQPLCEAIEQTDAETNASPAYYMVNCAHPTHFDDALQQGAEWVTRFGGVRANASMLSHAELEKMEQLDTGDPHDLGQRLASLRRRFPSLNVLGGCCGTDSRHIEAIAAAISAA